MLTQMLSQQELRQEAELRRDLQQQRLDVLLALGQLGPVALVLARRYAQLTNALAELDGQEMPF